jgi:hypothetical protein
MYVGKYLFRFDDAIVLGCCSGARTTTASLGMVNDRAKSQMTYAVGNILLTTWHELVDSIIGAPTRCPIACWSTTSALCTNI